MADYLDRGLPFQVDDLWRPPSALNTHDEATVFPPITTDLPPLALPKEFENLKLDLDIPELQDVPDGFPASDSEKDENAAEVPDFPRLNHEEKPDLDIWDLEKEFSEQENRPKLCTWEAFERKDVPDSERVALLSESGPGAFDAVVSSLEPRNEIGVLPQDYTLRALCNLVLGRSSSLFQWDPAKAEFKQTLEGASISGLSRPCGGSIVEDLIAVGNLTSKLRIFASRSLVLRACPAFVALQSSTSTILDAIDESISRNLASVRSILQLRILTARPLRLMVVLEFLVSTVKQRRRNEDVISSVFEVVSNQNQTQHEIGSISQSVLAKVCAPWLEELASDLGFRRPDSALLGATQSTQESTATWTEHYMFVGSEDAELIRETISAVKLLRATCPDHHLLADGQGTMFSSFTDPATTKFRAFAVARQYEEFFRDQHAPIPAIAETLAWEEGLNAPLASGDMWKEEASTQTYLDNLDALMSTAASFDPAGPADELTAHVREFCSLTCEQPLDNAKSFIDSSMSPLEHVRPLVQVQHRLLNGVLMRQLFREHNLKHHFQLQYSFQLFGNGYFVDRLSIALFRSDVQTAERRRDQKITAETMGLRLGASHEERWPPASSELQLALAGILNEAYTRNNAEPLAHSLQAESLPGFLSFAIRELPEAEIDRVLDPNSIYALDFLRLQYTASPPLDAILTSEALKAYDDMFRFLLRLLRVLHVTSNLPRKQTGRKHDTLDAAPSSFAAKAQSFVSVMLSHAMDIGIAAPWSNFMRTVSDLETTLQTEDAAEAIGTKAPMGIEGLRQLHDTCLDQMRSRLFLKRKQEKLRNGFESVLVAILNTSFASQSADEFARASFDTHYADFGKSVTGLLKLLQEQVNKPPKSIAAADTEDAEMLRLLLTRLDWNGFYSGG